MNHDPAVPAAKPPHPLLTLTEGQRAFAEYLCLLATRRRLAPTITGGGRPVLVLPGLLTGDATTAPLRRLLADRGYTPYRWGLGANIGPTPAIIRGVDTLIDRITDSHGEPAAVVGWSLGGLLGRDLAVRHPEKVDRLIALGAPLHVTDPRQSRAWFAYHALARFHLPEYSFSVWKTQQIPESLAATSIYTRQDGIGRWQACLLPPNPRWENVEVFGSHNGLGFNPFALRVVIDRLGISPEKWSPFVPPRRLRRYYPSP